MMAMEHHLADIDSIYKDFKRIQKVDTTLSKLQKQNVEDMRERLNEKLNGAKERVAHMRNENREKREYLIEKDKKRDELIKEVKDAFTEEVNQKKEISLLKKRD